MQQWGVHIVYVKSTQEMHLSLSSLQWTEKSSRQRDTNNWEPNLQVLGIGFREAFQMESNNSGALQTTRYITDLPAKWNTNSDWVGHQHAVLHCSPLTGNSTAPD